MIADKIRADAEAARIESEWKFAAMVNIIATRMNVQGLCQSIISSAEKKMFSKLAKHIHNPFFIWQKIIRKQI